jgi:hypothetical protein
MADDALGDIETFTKAVGGRTETYLRNKNPHKTIRVTVRSVCHNPRMNTVASYDVFPGKERRIGDDGPGGPAVTRKIEAVAYAPPPGRSKDQ